MIFISKFMVPKGYTGITLYPFIFLKKKHYKKNKILINHEKIHLRQQLELLIFPFYVIYGLDYLVKLIVYKNHLIAYKNISFEREAYQNESNLNYLKNRKLWAFTKYLKQQFFLYFLL
ncbi:hypothetical protein [Polaribacter porphyrae]|uniref:DUF4157 domain-containing protein n=1 Tax=Polaribacter porphyrae TaxID=1137780 RepID=A0A2S7WT99_9FLAO|nr:hypothetical protein [Polaribacter porphyrae]PQJ80835.1 hypothetical protein BTO18_17380 [Polaribacter porphyrae]